MSLHLPLAHTCKCANLACKTYRFEMFFVSQKRRKEKWYKVYSIDDLLEECQWCHSFVTSAFPAANVDFDLICALVGGAGLRWNTGMCIRDIKFASCSTDSSNRRWFELVWAGMCIDRQGKLLCNLHLIACPQLECYILTWACWVFKEGEGKPKINYVTVFERPGLKEFLKQLSEFADMVLFTAGLEGLSQNTKLLYLSIFIFWELCSTFLNGICL